MHDYLWRRRDSCIASWCEVLAGVAASLALRLVFRRGQVQVIEEDVQYTMSLLGRGSMCHFNDIIHYKVLVQLRQNKLAKFV